MGIQASKHNYTSLHVHGGWNWTTSASACRFGLLRYLGASAEYSASGSRRERWWGNPVLDGAVGRRKSDRNRSWSFQIFQKPERIRKDPMFLLISDDIDLHWNANIRISFKHVQTISITGHNLSINDDLADLASLGISKSSVLLPECTPFPEQNLSCSLANFRTKSKQQYLRKAMAS